MAFQIKGEDKITYDNLNNNVTTLMQPKNWIINGGFDVWQRGTSFTSSGIIYTADRWLTDVSNELGAHTFSRQAFTIGQNEVPNNPKYFFRFSGTTGSNENRRIVQKIESPQQFSGKTVSLSFWAKGTVGVNIVVYNYVYHSSGVIEVKQQTVSLSSNWTRYTITYTFPNLTGYTFTNNNYDEIRFTFPNSTAITFDIANVSLVEGSVPVEWQTEAYADVLRQCQRYFWKSFPQETAPGYNKGLSGAIFLSVVSGYNDGFALSVNMRAKPTLTSYNPSGASGQSTTGATLGNNNSSESIISVEYGSVVGNTWAHITADAEL